MKMSSERKFYFKVILGAYAVWIIAFQIVGRYAATLNTYDPTTSIDGMIPLLPDFVWFYALCYIFPLLPLFVVKDYHRLNITILCIVLANISAFVVYLTYPVAFPRPELGQSLADKILYIEYTIDFYPGANKLPSMHVSFAWFVYFAIRGQNMRKSGEAFVLFLTVMITLSTLFVKQHIILDVIAGILWAFLTWGLSKYLYPYLTNQKIEPPAALRQMLQNIGVLLIYTFVLGIALIALRWGVIQIAIN